MAKSYRIAVIAGDGIGHEVMPEGIAAMEAAARATALSLSWSEFDWSCERYARTGRMMPEDGLDRLRLYDAVYLGAVGHPDVPDHVSLWGLLIPLRRGFHQYVNLRPVRLLAGVQSPLRDRAPGDIDFYVVRENNEGEYSEIGGRLYAGSEQRDGDAADGVHPPRLRPDHALRLRACAQPQKARDLGDQVERHHPHDAVLGRALRRDRRATIPTSRPTSTTSTS